MWCLKKIENVYANTRMGVKTSSSSQTYIFSTFVKERSLASLQNEGSLQTASRSGLCEQTSYKSKEKERLTLIVSMISLIC